ncbi:unnamed protein product [Parnassius mnemosyne]|uniref:Reverse transcriptase RNase H-like domain-containing protein n=1 Tax=Parnassius mnemosyne TaxID=213953 RepID=A0AAV1KVP2_9NEOP
MNTVGTSPLAWAVKHLKIYLLDKEFQLISDHKPLEAIFGIRFKLCVHIERWVLWLHTYKYKGIHRPGKENIADAISRHCESIHLVPFDNENYINAVVEYSRPIAVPLNEIDIASASDKEIAGLKWSFRQQVG